MKNLSFMDHASGKRLPDGCKLATNRKKDNDITICRHDVIINFFNVAAFLLSYLITGPSVNIMTGSGVMTIFVYKGLTRNPEIGNTPV